MVLFAGALDKQRQMYEEKIEELRNQMVPVGRQAMERTSSIGSFSSGYGSSRMSWCEDRLATAWMNEILYFSVKEYLAFKKLIGGTIILHIYTVLSYKVLWTGLCVISFYKSRHLEPNK